MVFAGREAENRRHRQRNTLLGAWLVGDTDKERIKDTHREKHVWAPGCLSEGVGGRERIKGTEREMLVGRLGLGERIKGGKRILVTKKRMTVGNGGRGALLVGGLSE